MSGDVTVEQRAELRRDHLAYAPEHGLYAVYRGAGGIALASVLGVIGCAGAFVVWPSFELRPVASVLTGVWWMVWWSVVFLVYWKGVFRLTTDVLASVEMGANLERRRIARIGVAIVGLMLVLVLFSVAWKLIARADSAWTRGGLAELLIVDRSLTLGVFALIAPVWMVSPVIVQLRDRSGLASGRPVMLLAYLATVLAVVALVLSRLGGVAWSLGAVLALAFASVAMVLVGWLAAGLRRRMAAIMGAIARIEGEEAGRGEVARVFSGGAGAGRETE